MSCVHLIAFRAENGTHYCRDCGVALAVVERDVELTRYQQAVGRTLETARVLVKASEGSDHMTYVRALRELGVCISALDEWGPPDEQSTEP